jgi:uncharacterized damage-inducible protein DinB
MGAMATDTETARVADQLHRSYAGKAWHGPSLSELLADVTTEQASRRPDNGGHSIWELVLHVAAWMRIGCEHRGSKSVRQIADEENWPPVKGTWADAIAELDREVRALEEAIRAFPDERLNRRAPAVEPQSYYGLMHGIVQHNLYHAGQIAILKKSTPTAASRAGRPA